MQCFNLSLSLFLIIGTFTLLSAQENTIGVITYDDEKATPGYNLHYPHGQGNVYLLDNCGEIVHQWEEDGFVPGNGVYLHDNGYLYVCKGNGSNSNNLIHHGGGGEKLEVRDWNNNIVWEYTINDTFKRMHHDIAVNPNTGGVFIISWERKFEAEAVGAGRDPNQLDIGELWPDYIVEVEPDGMGSGTIVWEWHAWDHLIQDFDNTKDNFGNPAMHPERIDINYFGGPACWMHANSIDYNPELDQLILSVREFNEFWIIDHNTSSEEAAGPAGDLLFRWGNPATYRAGGTADQKLFGQHDVHWARVSEQHPDYGKIAVFNNRAGTDFSTVHLIETDYDPVTNTYPMQNGEFLPMDFDWSYERPVAQELYSDIMSSIQRLENGNTLISTGRGGYVFELDTEEAIVWEFRNPLLGTQQLLQGDTTASTGNQFRFNRYAPEHPAFTDRDLMPQGYIELEPNPVAACMMSSIEELPGNIQLNIFPNPSNGRASVQITGSNEQHFMEVFDILGKRIYQGFINGASAVNLETTSWHNGIYLVFLDHQSAGKILVQHH